MAKKIKLLPIAKDLQSLIDKPFLVCGRDGVIRVRDGRSLEAYINDLRLIQKRAEVSKKGAINYIMVPDAVAIAGYQVLGQLP